MVLSHPATNGWAAHASCDGNRRKLIETSHVLPERLRETIATGNFEIGDREAYDFADPLLKLLTDVGYARVRVLRSANWNKAGEVITMTYRCTNCLKRRPTAVEVFCARPVGTRFGRNQMHCEEVLWQTGCGRLQHLAELFLSKPSLVWRCREGVRCETANARAGRTDEDVVNMTCSDEALARDRSLFSTSKNITHANVA